MPTVQQIVLFDRDGRVLQAVGEPGRYPFDPALSPDGTKVAAVRIDPGTGLQNVWTFDLASGREAQITDNMSTEVAIWSLTFSPDGRHVAYVSRRGSFSGIYRKAGDGAGREELLYQYTPGAAMHLTDWSADGRFLVFYPGSCSFLILVIPLGEDQPGFERQPVEWLREEYDALQGRVSPDSRFMAYLSNENEPEGRTEVCYPRLDVFVRPFNPSMPRAAAIGARPVRVSAAGARGMISWRQDGQELYYMTSDGEVMAVDIATAPAFRAETPKLLFKLAGRLPGTDEGGYQPGGAAGGQNVSADGQRFVFSVDMPPGGSSAP